MIKRLLILTLLTISLFAVAMEQFNPYQLMKVAADRTFTRLKNEQFMIYKNPDYLRSVVREELMPYIQIKYTGALLLGSYYAHATIVQLDAYFYALQYYLEQVYGQALASLYLYNYNEQQYQYKIAPEQPLDNRKFISIRVTLINSQGRPQINLDFQWRKNSKTGYWQVYDMITEGVSLIHTKKHEWNNILKTKGIDGLTRNLILSAKNPIYLEQHSIDRN